MPLSGNRSSVGSGAEIFVADSVDCLFLQSSRPVCHVGIFSPLATDSLPMPTPGLEPHQGAALVASEGAAPSPEAELKSSSPEVSALSSTVPLYNQRVGDSCSIHVHLENQRRMEYKNIVVSHSAGDPLGALTGEGREHSLD